jgi:hypothetical protein
MLKPDKEMWLRLIDLGTCELGILSNVFDRLDNRASLRAATSASRLLMNRCVKCVTIRNIQEDPTTELADIFPNADGLQIERASVLVVGHLASTSPRFLDKLRMLSVNAEGAGEACQALLSRCSTRMMLPLNRMLPHCVMLHGAIPAHPTPPLAASWHVALLPPVAARSATTPHTPLCVCGS